MSFRNAKSKTFCVEVHQVDVIRTIKGPDFVFLRTNLKNPCYPYTGTMSLRVEVTRGSGPKWVIDNFPGVDSSFYDTGTTVRPELHLTKKQAK